MLGMRPPLLLEHFSKCHFPNNAPQRININSVRESNFDIFRSINPIDLRSHERPGPFVGECILYFCWEFVPLCLLLVQFEKRDSKISNVKWASWEIGVFLQIKRLILPFCNFFLCEGLGEGQLVKINEDVLWLEVEVNVFIFIEELEGCAYLGKDYTYFIICESFMRPFSLETWKAACIAKLDEKADLLLLLQKGVSIDLVHILAVSSRKLDQIVYFFGHFCFVSFIFEVKNFYGAKIDIFDCSLELFVFWFPFIRIPLSCQVDSTVSSCA